MEIISQLLKFCEHITAIINHGFEILPCFFILSLVKQSAFNPILLLLSGAGLW